MNRRNLNQLLLAAAALAAVAALAASNPAAAGAMTGASAEGAARTKCTMTFNLKEWSVFYKVANGKGTITCDNGQVAHVRLEARGGGLSAGKGEIRDGKGTFSDVSDIKELFGSYAAAEASAGAVKNATASVVTKGEVTLGLSGTGTGWELGISFGKLTITRRVGSTGGGYPDTGAPGTGAPGAPPPPGGTGR